MAKIILAFGDSVIREVELSKGCLTIGRRRENDIVIDDPVVSGKHAVIVAMYNDFFLEDLNSTNGTQVNGQPIRKHYLQHGDIVELAQYRIYYLETSKVGPYSVTEELLDRRHSRSAPTTDKLIVLGGAKAGHEIALTKVLTTIGQPDQQIAVLIRQSNDCYLINYVEGNNPPLVNGRKIDKEGRFLKDRDIIDLCGMRLQILYMC